MKKSFIAVIMALLAVSTLALAACQPQVIRETVQVEVERTVEVVSTVEVEVEKTVMVQVTPEPSKYKLAVILPGVITDADYNTLGYLSGMAVQKDMGIEWAYSESVPVPDVDRVMREYIDQGYNIIFAHGGQFKPAVVELAKAFPDLTFICEGDAEDPEAPANYWQIDRNFHVTYYVMGYIAGRTTQTGKIGYIAGLTMPFTYQEVHAIQQALTDHDLDVELKTIWAGDFNDPTKARQVADTMIAENVDVIMGSLNLGMFGIFEAAKAAQGAAPVLVTAKYTDKTTFAPANYITSSLYDFAGPLKNIIQKTMEGTTGGYYPMTYGDGFSIQTPVRNVPEDVAADIEALVEDIKSGKITVVKDATEIK
jgi:basic membrane protein A